MRIVVKIGSNVLARADGRLCIARMAELVDEVAALCEQGHQVLIVTSGAVAAGRAQVNLPKTVDRVARRQVLSAVGQAILIDTYRSLFAANDLNVGQILVTKSDFDTPEKVANIQQCIQAFFAYGIVPVINENDTVSVESLMFTDNDELAGQLATHLNADQLIILSSIDGLYTGDPNAEGSQLIQTVAPGEDLSRFVVESKTASGRGGMGTKLAVATQLASRGIEVVVANGFRHGILTDILTTKTLPHTRFTPRNG